MPPKKKAQANGFFSFMMEMKPHLLRQGVVIQNGTEGLVQYCGPLWKELPEEEKARYKELAKMQKGQIREQSRRNPPASRPDRMDCTGQFISKRVDKVKLNEDKRRKQRQEVVASWPPGKAVCDETFYFIGFMSLVEYPNNEFLPCEVAVAEFTIREGIKRTYNSFIKPGEIRLGYRYQASSTSEQTHHIPLEGLASEDDTYHKIWTDILNFVNPNKKPIFPPVYCRVSETSLTEYSLNWLSRAAELPNKLRKVFELEGLICDLHAYSSDDPNHITIHKAMATEVISTTVFDFEPGSRCLWHENEEVKFCALGTVTRACYSIADFLCPKYDIPLTTKHLPERPDGVACTIIKFTSHTPSSSAYDDDDDWSRDNGPYAARDIRYKGQRQDKNSTYFPRRGPTYQEDTAVSDSSVELTLTPQETPISYTQPEPQGTQAKILPGLGRGRGRGRGSVPAPNRANIPGMMTTVKQPALPPAPGRGRGIESLAWQLTPGSTFSNVQSGIQNISITDQDWPSLGTAINGSVRAPTTRPKAWAGGINPPPPSQAPLPPSSWLQ